MELRQPLLACVLVLGCNDGNENNNGADTDPVSTDECDSFRDCDALEICYTRQCQEALDRRYRVTVVSLEVGTTDLDGQYWDFGGGAPDLTVIWGHRNGDQWDDDACQTEDGLDSFSEVWNESCEFVLTRGDSFSFVIYESDLSSYDSVLGWTFAGNDDLTVLARLSELQSVDLDHEDITLTIAVSEAF